MLVSRSGGHLSRLPLAGGIGTAVGPSYICSSSRVWQCVRRPCPFVALPTSSHRARARNNAVTAPAPPLPQTSEEDEDGDDDDVEDVTSTAGTGQQAQDSQQQAQGSEASVSALSALPEMEMVTEEVTEEEIVYDKPVTLQSIALDAQQWVTTTNVGKGVVVAAAALLLGSLGLAIQRYIQKYQSARNTRLRQVNRNKVLVDELSKAIPGNRALLTPRFVKGVQSRTGVTAVELFRKYLWFLLRERKFDQTAVDDLVVLKQAAGLSDDDVAEAIRERAQRVYEKYGTLMLSTDGMSSSGIERKAACTALFRKLLFLTEHAPLLAPDSPAAATVDLKRIFGAFEEDVVRLRIVSLYDIDLEKAFDMPAQEDDAEDDDKPGDAAGKGPSPGGPTTP